MRPTQPKIGLIRIILFFVVQFLGVVFSFVFSLIPSAMIVVFNSDSILEATSSAVKIVLVVGTISAFLVGIATYALTRRVRWVKMSVAITFLAAALPPLLVLTGVGGVLFWVIGAWMSFWGSFR